VSLEIGGNQLSDQVVAGGSDAAATTGWFSGLFGWFQRDSSLPNAASNGSDVPTPNYGSTTKYSLPFWGGQDGGVVNENPPADQSWFGKIWSGAKSVGQFVFCPIFTTCPAPLPPGGITIGGIAGEAGSAAGNAAKNALSPILPILLVLAAVLLLGNILLARLASGGK
jgi:hypothetical protein